MRQQAVGFGLAAGLFDQGIGLGLGLDRIEDHLRVADGADPVELADIDALRLSFAVDVGQGFLNDLLAATAIEIFDADQLGFRRDR